MRLHLNYRKAFGLTAILVAFSCTGKAWSRTFQAIKGESSLSYLLVHPMHKISGVSRDFTCTVELSPDTLSSKVKVSATIRSFDSKNSSRDSHAMEVLEGLKYPSVVFESQTVKKERDGYIVSGDLTFHGHTHPISFHIKPRYHQHKIEVVGGFDVLLSDYEVKRPSLLFVPVENKLTISMDLFSLYE
jgi:polyisoprenoid-binding protein YceI